MPNRQDSETERRADVRTAMIHVVGEISVFVVDVEDGPASVQRNAAVDAVVQPSNEAPAQVGPDAEAADVGGQVERQARRDVEERAEPDDRIDPGLAAVEVRARIEIDLA